MKKVLITGAAGFIGSYLSKKLLDNNYIVIGVDSLNNYYDATLKKDRLKNINNDNFIFIKEDINDENSINDLFIKYKPEIVIHLAAYAGVRYSSENPDIYIKNNILGFYNILKLSSKYKVKHFIFTSSSSIYGNNENVPYKEEDVNTKAESIYASTKLCDEVLTYSYSKIFDMPITAIRPFTVYGPYGRPDMAYFNFTNKLINNEKIYLYNNGNMKRDFTYITDIINGIYNIVINKPKGLFNIYNIGSSKPYTLIEFINILKKELKLNNLVPEDFDLDSLIEYTDMKKGEVYSTCADITKIKNDFGYKVEYTLEKGIHEFIKWYKDYYNK